jgi:acyl-CoA-binding protein
MIALSAPAISPAPRQSKKQKPGYLEVVTRYPAFRELAGNGREKSKNGPLALASERRAA